jgi:hypothetical protein
MNASANDYRQMALERLQNKKQLLGGSNFALKRDL